MDYDADHAPSPAFVAAPEPERLAAVEAHHARLAAHSRMPKPRLHAALHVVVEAQLASGQPPEAGRAVERLVAGGLARHEALHAVALIVSNVAAAALEGRAFDGAAYARELDALTVERWRHLSADG